MSFKKNIKNTGELLKSVFLFHSILVLHVLLIAFLGCLVLFFKGIVTYMPWIFLAGSIFILCFGYFLYRKVKKQNKAVKDVLSLLMLKDRSVEVSLLGGFASFKIGKSNGPPQIENQLHPDIPQLEHKDTFHVDELTELARLFENNLITLDEYNKAKQEIFKL